MGCKKFFIVAVLLDIVRSAEDVNRLYRNDSYKIENREASLVNIKITHLSAEIGRPMNIKFLKRNEQLKIHAGLSLTMKCQVMGKPEPSVAWYKVAKMISRQQRSEAVLYFASISETDSSNYSCRAQNTNGHIIKWIQVQVIPSEPNNDLTTPDWTSQLNIRPCSEGSRCQFRDCKSNLNLITCLMRCDIAQVAVPHMQRKSCQPSDTLQLNDCLNPYYIIFGFTTAIILGIFVVVVFCYRLHKQAYVKAHSSNRNNHGSYPKSHDKDASKRICPDSVHYGDGRSGPSLDATPTNGQHKVPRPEDKLTKNHCFEPLIVNGCIYKSNILD